MKNTSIPTFTVKPAACSDNAKKAGQVSFICPICGKKNVHGAFDGHRVADCGCWKDGYFIVCRESA